MPSKIEIYPGNKFGKLTAVNFEYKKNKNFYWLFSCNCGKSKVIDKRNVLRGATKSCGCSIKETRHKLPEGEAAFNVLLYTYKDNAKKRSLEFSLNKDEFKLLTKSNCHYCGIDPQLTVKREKFNGNYLYNGIDRLDNKLGYITSNCVSCCETCNRAKLEMDVNTFESWIKKVYMNIEEKKNGK